MVLRRSFKIPFQKKPLSREGQGTGRWVLLDYVNVVVHVFQREVRDFYEIEDLWHDGIFTHYEEDLVTKP